MILPRCYSSEPVYSSLQTELPIGGRLAALASALVINVLTEPALPKLGWSRCFPIIVTAANSINGVQTTRRPIDREKRTAIRSSSVWGSKDDLFPVGQNPTKSIQNLQTWLNICHVISSHNCKRSNSKVIQWSKNNCGFLWLASGVECLSKGFH